MPCLSKSDSEIVQARMEAIAAENASSDAIPSSQGIGGVL